MGFADDIAKFIKKSGVRADRVLRKVSLDAFGGMISKSPVREGTFRGAWVLGVNRIEESTGEKDLDGSRTFNAGADKLLDVHFGDTIYITNNMIYAVPLENGSSDQAPDGVMNITVDEIKAGIANVVKRMK